jgi:general secretion pathway protein A
MYLHYFSLSQYPFLISPNPDFLYFSRSHEEALAHLRYGLDREGGFMLLTGEVGTGKTTLCRLLMDDLPDSVRLGYLLNTKLDSAGILVSLCRELDVDYQGAPDDIQGLVAALYENLLQAHGDGQRTLVVIEEAQNLSSDVLESLRLLTNLETNERKLLHILLVGQPELLDTLHLPALRQLNQRVIARCHLDVLPRGEVAGYLQHRLRVAGLDRALFTASAAAQLHSISGGIPRVINLIAERSLIAAYALERPVVNRLLVRRAAREVLGPKQAIPAGMDRVRSGFIGAVAATLLAMVAGLVFLPKADWNVRSVSEAIALEPAPAKTKTGGNQLALKPGRADAPSPAAPSGPDQRETAQSTTSVFSLFLDKYHIGAAAGTIEQLCGIARRTGFACEEFQGLSADFLEALARPALVPLADGTDGFDYYVFSSEDGGYRLTNSAGTRTVDRAEFESRWRGEGTLLWQPPAGYSAPLYVGTGNRAVVDYLLQSLRSLGYVEGALVTGGIYNGHLAGIVREFQGDAGLAVDGIVGPKTLMMLAGNGSKLSSLAGR